jgi:uncharacterized iron-regulated membrane protein
MKARQLIVKVHGLIGIAIGLLIVVVSITGSAIVFQAELDAELNRSLFHVSPQAQVVSIDAILDSVQTAYPKLPLAFIQVPKTPDTSYIINQQLPHEQRRQTFVDPYTGEVLGSRIWEQSLIGWMYAVHHNLLAGITGQIVVGVAGLGLLFIVISGTMLWTGWRKLATGFKIRWRSPVALFNYDLHNVGGIVSSVLLVLSAATGVAIVGLHLLPMLAPSVEARVPPNQQIVALSQLLKTANAAMPEGKITTIEFSEEDPELLTIRKKLPTQDTGRFDFSTIELNRYSGELIAVTKVEKAEGIFKFMVTIADLHFGTFGQLPTRILYLGMGFMPMLLFVTGLANWRRRQTIGHSRQTAVQLAQASAPQKP